jgi:hypothetical protein
VSGITKIETLTTGRFSLGTRWRETREVLGCGASMTRRWRSLPSSGTAGTRSSITRLAFASTRSSRSGPVPGGTKVSIEFGPGQLVPGLLSPLEWAIAGKVRDVLTRDLSDLEEAIEKVGR